MGWNGCILHEKRQNKIQICSRVHLKRKRVQVAPWTYNNTLSLIHALMNSCPRHIVKSVTKEFQ